MIFTHQNSIKQNCLENVLESPGGNKILEKYYDFKPRSLPFLLPGELGRWGPADGKPHGLGCLMLHDAQHLGSFRNGRAEGEGFCLNSSGQVRAVNVIGWGAWHHGVPKMLALMASQG